MKELQKYALGLGASDSVLEWVDTHVPEVVDQGEAEHIIDYLISDKAPKRLRKASYEAMKANAEKWVRSMNKKGANIEEGPEDVEVILDYGDGFRFVRLVGQRAYEREGFLMKHCVASYYGRDVKVYSLRDKNNMPHATVEWGQQVKGKGNGPISPKYIKYVVEFMEAQGMTMRASEMRNLGYQDVFWLRNLILEGTALYRDRYFYGDDLPALKPHTMIKDVREAVGVGPYLYFGDLDLRDTEITSLPDGLSVGGSLYLRDTEITSLPDGLSVGGSLYLRDCLMDCLSGEI